VALEKEEAHQLIDTTVIYGKIRWYLVNNFIQKGI